MVGLLSLIRARKDCTIKEATEIILQSLDYYVDAPIATAFDKYTLEIKRGFLLDLGERKHKS